MCLAYNQLAYVVAAFIDVVMGKSCFTKKVNYYVNNVFKNEEKIEKE